MRGASSATAGLVQLVPTKMPSRKNAIDPAVPNDFRPSPSVATAVKLSADNILAIIGSRTAWPSGASPAQTSRRDASSIHRRGAVPLHWPNARDRALDYPKNSDHCRNLAPRGPGVRIRGILRMHHSFDRLGIGSKVEPFADLRQIQRQVAQQGFALEPHALTWRQIGRHGHGYFVTDAPDSFRI